MADPMLDASLVGAVARLKAEPQEKWLSVLEEFAAEVQALVAAGSPPEQPGACSACGEPADRCLKCAAKDAVSGFAKDKARDVVAKYGPVVAEKGVKWLQGLLEEGRKPDQDDAP